MSAVINSNGGGIVKRITTTVPSNYTTSKKISLPDGFTTENTSIISAEIQPTAGHGWQYAFDNSTVHTNLGIRLFPGTNSVEVTAAATATYPNAPGWAGCPLRITLMKVE